MNLKHLDGLLNFMEEGEGEVILNLQKIMNQKKIHLKGLKNIVNTIFHT